MLPGCSASDRIFEPAVYAATVVEPKPLTTPCRIMPPTAVTEFMTPTGTPRRRSSQSIAPSGRASPCSNRISSMRLSTKRHIRPESSCASTVAQAAPATPQRNTMTNSTSSPTLTAELMRMTTSGETLSPSARRMLASTL